MSTCFPVGGACLYSPAKQGGACGSTFLPVLGLCCFWKATLLWSVFVAPWWIIRLSVSSHLRVIYCHLCFPSHSWACLCLLPVSLLFFFLLSSSDPSHILNNDLQLCFTNSVSDWSWFFSLSSGDFTEQKPLLLLNFVNFFLMICAFLTRLKRSLRYYLLFCKKKGFKILLFLFYFLICLELIFMYGVRQESIFIYG